MFKRKCKITYICHGSTIHSEENRLSDIENYPPLNDSGYDEMERICEFLKKRGIQNDKIYCSPALRTIQSAEMVAKVFKKDFEVIDELYSRKRGVWNGLTYEQIEVKYPQMLDKWHKNPCSFYPEGGETTLSFNERVSKAINSTVEKNIGNRIIIITYPDVIQSAICSALALPPENQAKVYIKTGSATQISYFDGWASLLYCGYVPI